MFFYLQQSLSRAIASIYSDDQSGERSAADWTEYERKVAFRAFLSENPADYDTIGRLPVGVAYGYAIRKLRQIRNAETDPGSPEMDLIEYDGEPMSLSDALQNETKMQYQNAQTIPRQRV